MSGCAALNLSKFGKYSTYYFFKVATNVWTASPRSEQSLLGMKRWIVRLSSCVTEARFCWWGSFMRCFVFGQLRGRATWSASLLFQTDLFVRDLVRFKRDWITAIFFGVKSFTLAFRLQTLHGVLPGSNNVNWIMLCIIRLYNIILAFDS